jgi:hypothetical protein
MSVLDWIPGAVNDAANWAGGAASDVGNWAAGAANAGMAGLGSLVQQTMPGPNGIPPFVNNAVNSAAHAFDLPGGHTDGTYDWAGVNPYLPPPQANTYNPNIMQNMQNMPGLGAYARDPSTQTNRAWLEFPGNQKTHAPWIQDIPKPAPHAPVIQDMPHGSQYGVYQGSSWGSGPLAKTFETYDQGGKNLHANPNSDPATHASPNWQGNGQNFTRTY